MKVNTTNIVFILDTSFLKQNDRPRAFEKEKELASLLLEKDIYKGSNIKIGVGRSRQPTELVLNKNAIARHLKELIISDSINLEKELKEAIGVLSGIESEARKSIVLFTVGSKYNAYPELLKNMKKENIKLVVVDVNKALSKPVVDPPFAAEPPKTDLPDIATPEPEVSEIVTVPFTG